jgi:hypothetical protein
METLTEGELTIPLPPTAQPTVSATLSTTTAHKKFRIIFALSVCSLFSRSRSRQPWPSAHLREQVLLESAGEESVARKDCYENAATPLRLLPITETNPNLRAALRPIYYSNQ